MYLELSLSLSLSLFAARVWRNPKERKAHILLCKSVGGKIAENVHGILGFKSYRLYVWPLGKHLLKRTGYLDVQFLNVGIIVMFARRGLWEIRKSKKKVEWNEFLLGIFLLGIISLGSRVTQPKLERVANRNGTKCIVFQQISIWKNPQRFSEGQHEAAFFIDGQARDGYRRCGRGHAEHYMAMGCSTITTLSMLISPLLKLKNYPILAIALKLKNY